MNNKLNLHQVNTMSQLIVNLPPQKVWVRKEYLCDLQSGYGEFVEGSFG